jgi:hypothetical protein
MVIKMILKKGRDELKGMDKVTKIKHTTLTS